MLRPYYGTDGLILSIANLMPKEDKAMDKYECPCGYIYDPEEGDYENGIDAGTAFADLPDEWVCPKCGAEKEHFYKI